MLLTTLQNITTLQQSCRYSDIQQKREQQATNVHSPVVQILCWDIDSKINLKIRNIGQGSKISVAALLLTEQTQIKQMQSYKAGIYMHRQSIPYCSVCLSQYSTHKANHLAHEDFYLCVAFHIGEKGLLAENVCIIRDNTKKSWKEKNNILWQLWWYFQVKLVLRVGQNVREMHIYSLGSGKQNFCFCWFVNFHFMLSCLFPQE